MLSDRLHLNPCNIAPLASSLGDTNKGRGSEKWADSINWWDLTNRLYWCCSWSGWRRRVERMPTSCEEGQVPGLGTFFLFLSYLPSSLLSPHPSFCLSLLFLNPLLSFLPPSLDNKHTFWIQGENIGAYTYKITYAHIHICACIYDHIHVDKHIHMYTHGALIPCVLNNKSNNSSSSSYHLLRAMYQPPWSVLYSIISILRSSLWGSFHRYEADINLGWDEKKPVPEVLDLQVKDVTALNYPKSQFFLLNTDFQQSEFVRSHTGTGGPNGVVSQVQGPGLLTLGSKGTSSLCALFIQVGNWGEVWKCGLGLRVWGTWGLHALLSGMPALGRRWFWAFFLEFAPLGRIIPVFSGPPVRE